MPHPLTVQLCDKLGNHSDEANIKVVLNCDRGLKVCRCTDRSFSCPLQTHLQNKFICELCDSSHIFPMRLRSFCSMVFSFQEQRDISLLRWIKKRVFQTNFPAQSERTYFTWSETIGSSLSNAKDNALINDEGLTIETLGLWCFHRGNLTRINFFLTLVIFAFFPSAPTLETKALLSTNDAQNSISVAELHSRANVLLFPFSAQEIFFSNSSGFFFAQRSGLDKVNASWLQ